MDKLIKWFVGSDNVCGRLSWFIETIPRSLFAGIDAILYDFLVYCNKLGIPAKRKFLEVFLRTEGLQLIKQENIRVESTEIFDYNEPCALEEAYRVISSATLTAYDTYTAGSVDNSEFKAAMKVFMEEVKANELQTMLSQAYTKITAGDNRDTIILEMQNKLDLLTDTFSDERLEDIDFIEGKSYKQGEKNKQKFLFETGIPCIDGDIGGMYTRQMWTFTGPPGGGKTRFALVQFAYRAAVIGKMDVLFDELELSQGEVENILIAYHIINLYRGRVKIPDRDMTKGRLDEQQKQIYEAAKVDLFESGKYGKIVIDCRGLDVSTLKRKRLQYFKLNPKTRLWIVDYIGLLEHNPKDKYAKHLVKYEIITEGIRIIKKISSVADIGTLCLCQYSDDGIKAMAAGKPVVPGMTEGGHVISRHSDYDIAMTMTEEQELAGVRLLSTVKKRAAAGFKNIPLRTDLAVSIFKQVSSL